MSPSTSSLRAWLSTTLVAAGLLASASAHANGPVVTFDMAGLSSTITPGTTHVLNLRYAVTGTNLENATISVDLPPGVLPTGAGHDATWAGGCQPDGNQPWMTGYLDWSCSWTAAQLQVPQGGVSGQIPLTVRFARFAFGNGENVSIQPTFNANWNDNGTSRAINPLTTTGTTTIQGTVQLDWQSWMQASEWNYAYVDLGGGLTGLVVELQIGVRNTGSTRVDAGSLLEVDLPAGMVYAGFQNVGHPIELESPTTPGDPGPVMFRIPTTVGRTQAGTYIDGSTNGQYAYNIYEQDLHWFYFRGLVTCDGLPIDPTDMVLTTLIGTATGVTSNQPGELTSNDIQPGWNLTSADSNFTCGRPMRTSMTRSSSAGASQFFSAQAIVHPPTGEVPVTAAYTCTAYPNDVRATSFSNYMPWASGLQNPALHGFEFYACNLPNVVGTFDRATFEASYRNSAECMRYTNEYYTIEPGATFTHSIIFAPESWGYEGDLGPTVWAPLASTANVVVNRCMAGAQPTTFQIPTYSSARVDGVLQSATSTLDIISPILATPSWYNTANPTTATRGQTQTLNFYAGLGGDSAAMLNPVVTMPVPAGVTVLEVSPQPGYSSENCLQAPITWTVDNGTLTVRAGTAEAPWYLDPTCWQNGCRQGGQLAFQMRVAFDAFHPFVNGQPVQFNMSLTGANVDTQSWNNGRADFPVVVTMQVPGEKRLVLGPTCDAANRTGLVTRFVNSGGIPLTNIAVTVPLPRQNDGSGTQVDPKLHAATTTLGTVQCSNDGTDFGHGCGASTTHVRVVVPNLDPYQSGELAVYFAPDASFALGAIVRHRASMTSNELLPINAPPGPPARWNRCPGTLSLDAWFDADGNGSHATNEPGLGNWTLRFTDLTAQAAGQNLVFDIVVPASGAVDIDLPPGEFGLEVVPLDPADANATWVSTLPVPSSITITTGNTTELNLAYGCTCNDNDSCTIDSCVVGGYCAAVIDPAVPGCIAECGNGVRERGETCDLGVSDQWVDGCYNCKCDFGMVADPNGPGCIGVCGDGYPAYGEECDDGGESETCSADCKRKCGNGVRDAGEQCDTGVETDLVGGCLECRCSFVGWYFDETANACLPRCGDNLIMGNEACDDGNTTNGDGCSSSCQVEQNWACEQPDYTGCLPAEFCSGELPDWCVISDPENPGASPNDWCGFLFRGREGSQFCGIGDLRCEAFETECPNFDPNNPNREDELCFWRDVFCGFCPTMGPSTCEVVCVPTTEVCNGLDDDCDGRPDFTPDGASTSVCRPVETEILTHPAVLTGATSATFTYHNPADPENTDYQCALDNGEWFECDGGTWTFNNLTNGQHVFRVRSVRGDGAVDDTPAFFNWTIDTTVPDTLITTAPGNPSGSPTAVFVFDSNLPEVEDFMCAIVQGSGEPAPDAWEPCEPETTFEGLEDGIHTVWVYAVTPAGVVDPTPAWHTWLVDSSQPETVITSSPPENSGSTEATFTYADPDDASITTFMCRLDNEAWFECDGGTHTFEGLADGDHTFEVYAVNELGVADESPATWTWNVDTAPPDTFITNGPSDPSGTGTGTFTFSSNEEGVSYFCVIVAAGATPDANAYEPCNATTNFTGLADGTWTMWVYAEDPAGNVDDTPATWTWTIDSSSPETVITNGPEGQTPSGTPVTVTYESPNGDDDTGFDCRIDGGEWFACDGGTTTIPAGDLPPGEHTFEVRACDRERAVCDPTPASTTWTVVESPCPDDATAPVVSCTETVTLECVDGTATVDVQTFTPAATDTCEPVTVTAAEPEAYVLGDNPVVFTATDGNGNTASCATAVRIVDTAAPVLTCAADFSIATDPTFCGAVPSLAAPTANDACAGSAVVFTNDAPESFAPGATVVTWTGTDAAGNVATCTTTVTVTRGPNADDVCVDPDDGLVARGGAGCATGEGFSWFLLLGLAGLVGLRRRRLV